MKQKMVPVECVRRPTGTIVAEITKFSGWFCTQPGYLEIFSFKQDGDLRIGGRFRVPPLPSTIKNISNRLVWKINFHKQAEIIKEVYFWDPGYTVNILSYVLSQLQGDSNEIY